MEKLRFGLIGCGGNQRYHVSTLAGIPEVEIVALADTSEEQVAHMRDAHGFLAQRPVYSDFREMLDKESMDAVLISTPHTLHTEQILGSFAKGLHVLVEKPLATSVSDAEEVIAARNAAGKVGAIAYQRHGSPQFQYMRERIESGEFGRVLCLNSHLGQQWLAGTRDTWRQNPELSGGGQLNDSGSHMVDILLWITGLKPKRVSAFIDNRGAKVDIDSAISIEFEDGALGNITVIGDATIWHESHHIWLEHGVMVLQGDKLTLFDDRGRSFSAEHWPSWTSPDQNFVDAVLGRDEVLAPFECGLQVIKLTEAAWKSAKQGGGAVSV